MLKHLRYVACALLLPAVIAAAEDGRDESEPKVVSGMSIVGNGDDTPKSLYIVPWKTSEIGMEVTFTSGILNEELSPVDKSDFIRELDFYRQSNSD